MKLLTTLGIPLGILALGASLVWLAFKPAHAEGLRPDVVLDCHKISAIDVDCAWRNP